MTRRGALSLSACGEGYAHAAILDRASANGRFTLSLTGRVVRSAGLGEDDTENDPPPLTPPRKGEGNPQADTPNAHPPDQFRGHAFEDDELNFSLAPRAGRGRG